MDHKKNWQKLKINNFLVLRNWQQKLACLDRTQFSKVRFLKISKN